VLGWKSYFSRAIAPICCPHCNEKSQIEHSWQGWCQAVLVVAVPGAIPALFVTLFFLKKDMLFIPLFLFLFLSISIPLDRFLDNRWARLKKS